MSIENLAPYSPTTIYGQLTSPFTPKQITINARTPYDRVDETSDGSEVFSRAYFEGKPQAKIVYGNMSKYRPEYDKDFPPKNTGDTGQPQKTPSELSSFSVSSFSDNNILKGALSNGYSVDESIVIQNAYNAYRRSSLITKNAPEVLSTCSYRVF